MRNGETLDCDELMPAILQERGIDPNRSRVLSGRSTKESFAHGGVESDMKAVDTVLITTATDCHAPGTARYNTPPVEGFGIWKVHMGWETGVRHH